MRRFRQFLKFQSEIPTAYAVPDAFMSCLYSLTNRIILNPVIRAQFFCFERIKPLYTVEFERF